MSTLTYAISDSRTMLRRNLRHALRYPGMTLSVIGMPVIFLLLFVYVLGDTLSAGIGGGKYIDYLAPGLILMTVGGGTMVTAVGVCTDMTEGIVARFRTMAIARVSVLTGHVVGGMIQTLLSILLVFGLAVLLGFRPTTEPIKWLAAFGLIALLCFALIWLAVALGIMSKNPEGASNAAFPLVFLPFVGSTFVPTDSMAVGIRWFAEYQPFTPITETVRGLLMGTPIGNSAGLALAWCAVIGSTGYLWAKSLYNRDPNR